MARKNWSNVKTVGDALWAVGDERLPDSGAAGGRGVRRVTTREAVARKVWEMALNGDLSACRLLLEHTEGRPAPRRAPIAAPPDAVEPPTEAEAASADGQLSLWRAGMDARAAEPA